MEGKNTFFLLIIVLAIGLVAGMIVANGIKNDMSNIPIVLLILFILILDVCLISANDSISLGNYAKGIKQLGFFGGFFHFVFLASIIGFLISYPMSYADSYQDDLGLKWSVSCLRAFTVRACAIPVAALSAMGLYYYFPKKERFWPFYLIPIGIALLALLSIGDARYAPLDYQSRVETIIMPGNSVALGEHTKSAFQIVIRGYRRDDLRGTEEYITYNHTKYYISKGMFYRL